MDSIRVMIVDDEQLARKGLIKMVDWERFGMAVIADAANGEIGWNQFLVHRPELVITDIVMPQMNGIELTRKIKELSPETKILLLSCHSDFQYAQKAIKYGISGYVLKTSFDDEEMEGYLSKIGSEIMADRNLKKQSESLGGLIAQISTRLWSWLESNNEQAELADCLHMLAASRKWLLSGAQTMLLIHEDEEQEGWEGLQSTLSRTLPEEGYLFVSGLEDMAFYFTRKAKIGW